MKSNSTRRLLKAAGLLLCAIFLPVMLFLGAAAIGVFVPSSEHGPNLATQNSIQMTTDQRVTIYLLTSPLHADIVVPFGADLEQEFSWLEETNLPLNNPNLAYLGFGWGSRAFYTTAGNYSDIGFSNTFTAVTGDSAVMCVIGLPQLEASDTIIPVVLELSEFKALIEQIKLGFELNMKNEPNYLPQYSIGQNNAFYEGEGHFNIFNPCNQWAADALFASGVKHGAWTPTSYSLLWSLRWNGALK